MAGKPTDTLAVVFYVARKGEVGDPIPAALAFTPSGQARPIEVPTDVVETPRVEPESNAG